MADLSIITLTRDHADYVERLSDCLDAQLDGLTVERILVNNAVRKGAKTWDPSTRLGIKRGWMVIEPGYNTSFSEGNNLGSKVATSDYLLLLNDDMVLEPECLGNLWQARGRADLIGMLIMNTDGTVNHAGTCLWPTPHHIGRNDPRDFHEADAVMKCDAITFAAAFMRADWYHARGGLDERYIYGYEDTDFSCKSLDAGGTTAVAMNAIAIHDECGTRVRGDGGYHQNNSQLWRRTWTKERVERILEGYWNGRDFREHQLI
jgi:GT2 family glycosyltransferase